MAFMQNNNIKHKSTDNKVDIIKEVKSICIVVLVALLIRSFVVEPFYIPSSSMEHTLLEGDYIFTTKFSYGFSKHSIPFSPSIYSGRIFKQNPHRGDIVIFWPADMEKRYIKRLIGLPGDKIQLKEGVVFINDMPMQRKHIGKATDKNGVKFDKYVETLDNGVSYNILQLFDKNFNNMVVQANNTKAFYVPANEYFFLGDNRDGSKDSRWIGTIPLNNFIAKAQIIFFSDKYELWLSNSSIMQQLSRVVDWLCSIRFNRMFTSVYAYTQ